MIILSYLQLCLIHFKDGVETLELKMMWLLVFDIKRERKKKPDIYSLWKANLEVMIGEVRSSYLHFNFVLLILKMELKQ